MLEDTGVKINIDEQTRESSTAEMSKEFNKILEQKNVREETVV